MRCYVGRREPAGFRAVWEAAVDRPRKCSEVVKVCYWWCLTELSSSPFLWARWKKGSQLHRTVGISWWGLTPAGQRRELFAIRWLPCWFFDSHNPDETGREFDFRRSSLESCPGAFISYGWGSYLEPEVRNNLGSIELRRGCKPSGSVQGNCKFQNRR